MSTLDLLSAVGAAPDEYIMEACSSKKKQPFRPLLLAAVIALLLLLMGCAAWIYQLESLVIFDHREENAAFYISNEVLSIHGYDGSPAANAMQEWLTYFSDYITRHSDCRFQSEFRRPDAYEIYPCYTGEMVAQVDALCEKYGLHVVGKSTFLPTAAEMEANGLSRVLSSGVYPRCFYGSLFEDGSFVAEGELACHDITIQFQMHNIRKDAFYPVSLSVNNITAYTQWNYCSLDGTEVLLAQNGTTDLMITENADCFITVIIEEVPDDTMIFRGLPDDKAFLEALCDCFVYS